MLASEAPQAKCTASNVSRRYATVHWRTGTADPSDRQRNDHNHSTQADITPDVVTRLAGAHLYKERSRP
jgi:hypothetical protein